MIDYLDTQHDGQTYRKQRDPPGQKSHYIVPGNDSDENYRLGTFYKFPTDEIPIDPILLAKNGFYFTGYKDRVKCYSCGMNAENWAAGDDPSSHKWHYDHCLHVAKQDSRNVPRDCILNERTAMELNSLQNFYSRTTYDLAKFRTYIPPGDPYSEKYRLATFSKFPARFIEAPLLAMNGFMYTGDRSKVRCYSCGTTHLNLPPCESGDVKYHKPKCEHVIGMNPRNEPLNSLSSYRKTPKGQPSDSMEFTEYESFEANQDNKPTTNNSISSSSASASNTTYQSATRAVKKINLFRVEDPAHKRILENLNLYSEADRRKSFKNAPATLAAVGVNKLAATGFFFLGDTDRTQCFSCNGILRRWDGADSAYFEHRSNFPNCSMVKGTESSNIPDRSLGIGEGVPAPPMPNENQKTRLRETYKCENPTSPSMNTYEKRLRSFIGRWPLEDVKATPVQIARAGFFCLGDRDKAKCWYCNGGLQNWDYEDEPWAEHAKWFPGCEFVLQQLGPQFVAPIYQSFPDVPRPEIQNGVSLNSILSHHQEASSSTRSAGELLMSASIRPGRTPSVSNSSAQAISRQHSNSSAQVQALSMSSSTPDVVPPSKKLKPMQEEFSKMASKAKELGFSELVISKALLKKDSFTFLELLDVLLQEAERKGQLEEQSNWKTVLQPAPKVSVEIQNKLAKMEQERTCKLCKQNRADHLVLPCGHIVFCQACSEKKPERCALCKRKVDKFIKTFTA